MRYTVIDDNEMDRMIIESFFKQHLDFELFGSFSDPIEAIHQLSNYPPDVLFLDIEMPNLNGIDFLRSLPKPPLCVFITSHPEFALDAFELFALDYILKPLTLDRFEAAVSRIKSFIDIREKALSYEHYLEDDTVIIQEGYNTHRILLSEILYLEALKDYTRIFTKNKSYITLGNISRILESFNTPQFKRVHRSFAINPRYINSIIENNILIGTNQIPIGKTYKSTVSEWKKSSF
ncbi:LytR/AlgR family response regulator transcription factor [Fluviicola taffensis]|uniref:Two component transcriptional regulator, LytTR family n=1 Tax=Fluviicola taffensis (strain DSM 16823 / NCIMB 13979 / RW262) TaxID=755732 RepID=F2IEL5_FLUTR|nr:LytTR family DNA-binding domain-containing protein [Fluviicola taffensis]AEA44554.1 two component transcriptional regulator, LytTR family [Fluviicola taffensis DSM 16823]